MEQRTPLTSRGMGYLEGAIIVKLDKEKYEIAKFRISEIRGSDVLVDPLAHVDGKTMPLAFDKIGNYKIVAPNATTVIKEIIHYLKHRMDRDPRLRTHAGRVAVSKSFVIG